MSTPQTRTMGSGVKQFFIFLAAILAAASIIGCCIWVAKDVLNNLPETTIAPQQVTIMSPQQLLDFRQNTIGEMTGDYEDFGLGFRKDDLNIDHDQVKIMWITWLQTHPDACDKLHPSTTHHVDGCDAQYANGSWGYSVSIDEARAQLKKDVDFYNTQASKIDQNILRANGLPPRLDDRGIPIWN